MIAPGLFARLYKPFTMVGIHTPVIEDVVLASRVECRFKRVSSGLYVEDGRLSHPALFAGQKGIYYSTRPLLPIGRC